jgi:hypothetical protein
MIGLDTIPIMNTVRETIGYIHTEFITEVEKKCSSRRYTINIIITKNHHSLLERSSMSDTFDSFLDIGKKQWVAKNFGRKKTSLYLAEREEKFCEIVRMRCMR